MSALTKNPHLDIVLSRQIKDVSNDDTLERRPQYGAKCGLLQ